eukprot:307227_1
MAYKVFRTNHQCDISQQHDTVDTLNCQAINRLKIILNEFNDDSFLQNERDDESTLIDTFESIFIQNHYTNTSLLNDFHHIKYTHHADDDDDVFSKIHVYFMDGIGTACNQKKCQFIRRHYRDRSKFYDDHFNATQRQDNNGFNSHDARYMMDLISRIHVYFIHSYHIIRFTMEELQAVKEQTNDISNLKEDALEERRMQLLADTMKTKRNIIDVKWDNDKFNEPAQVTGKHHEKPCGIDLTKMHDILHKHDSIALFHWIFQ